MLAIKADRADLANFTGLIVLAQAQIRSQVAHIEHATDNSLAITSRCFDQPVNAATDAAGKLPRTYIASVKEEYPARAVFEPFAARARREGWTYHELPTGHDCQAEMPEALSELLHSAN